MKHIIDGVEELTSIQIEDFGNSEMLITIKTAEGFSECTLDVHKLHSFIGTLLHVQQKIKNRKYD